MRWKASLRSKRKRHLAARKLKGFDVTQPPAFLLISGTSDPDKTVQLQEYVSKVMAIHAAAGGKAVGKYSISEQLFGGSGTTLMALIEYPNADAVKTVVASEAFISLNALRDEVYLDLNLMIVSAM